MLRFTTTDAKQIGAQLGVDWRKISLKEFTAGLNVELEHGRRDPWTDVTHDDPILTGKIALAHLRELPDYYTRLATLEAQVEQARVSTVASEPAAVTEVEPVDILC